MNLDELNERLDKLQRSLSEAPKGLADFDARMKSATRSITGALGALKSADPRAYKRAVKAASDAMTHISRAQKLVRQ